MSDPLSVLTAYLHQDWEDFYPNFETAIVSLFNNEPSETTKPLLRRIGDLVNSDASDNEVKALLERHIDYAFELDGMDPRRFLREVLRIAEQTAPNLLGD